MIEKFKKRRFILFIFTGYGLNGGMSDAVCTFDALQEAEIVLEVYNEPIEGLQIFDMETLNIGIGDTLEETWDSLMEANKEE